MMSKVKPKNVSSLQESELLDIALMLHQGMSDKDIGDVVGVAPATISGLRRGVTRPNFETDYGPFPMVTSIDIEKYEKKWSEGGKDFRKLRSTTSTKELAKMYKVTELTIRSWVTLLTQVDQMNKQ